MDEQREETSHLVRNVAIGAGAITVLLVAIIIVPNLSDLTRDRWELRNADRVSAQLEEADRLQQSDSDAALRIYDEMLKEATSHEVTNEQLSQKLARAEMSRVSLRKRIREKGLAEEAEKQRKAEEARIAEEVARHLAEADERKRAADIVQRIAEEKRQAEEKQREMERLAEVPGTKALPSAALVESPPKAVAPFELKGDQVGVMTLDEFKRKYTRPTTDRPAPFCSDADERRGKDIVTLLAEAWHFEKGIVTASTHYPFERKSPVFEGGEPRGEFPTVAGAPAKFYIHYFVDGTLYQILVTFDHRYYDQVKAAMLAKNGKPSDQQQELLQNRLGAQFASELFLWENDVSVMLLKERSGTIDSSTLILSHKNLSAEAESRKPGPMIDDL